LVDVPPVELHVMPVAFTTLVLQFATTDDEPLQAPQLVTLPTVASQPLPAFESHAANPVSQVEIEQVLDAQVPVVTFARLLQSLLHAPQC